MRNQRRYPLLLGASLVLWTLAAPAFATSMLPQNVVDLISLSERILVGEVLQISDGIDGKNVPYTEVTVRVEDSIRGDNGATYTFRQFGLEKPKDLPDGTTLLTVSPPGWPRFQDGEKVMLFLYKEASITGLQTSVGLFQGKFTIQDGLAVNGIGNKNVFQNVDIDPAAMGPQDQMLLTRRGALPAEQFISFVRRAVDEQLVEKGRIRHAQ